METLKAIEKRSSVRSYKKDAVPKQTLEQLIDAGRRAPTARAVEPWEFVIITDRPMLSSISAKAENGRFIGDSFACILVISSDTKYFLEDGCAATENILLAAADMGLGTCWVAGDKKPYCQDILDMVGAPKGMKLVSMISVGWPAEDKPQKRSRLLKDILHWEKF